jgi:hypothetical protein|tara:strand:- start:770 stop:976 length:207 start_codon:yes stop_codon:yes gene_type:complete
MRALVKGNSALERDHTTNAILNNDSAGYKAALMRKKHSKKVANEFNALQNEVSGLKDLVKILIEKLDK